MDGLKRRKKAKPASSDVRLKFIRIRVNDAEREHVRRLAEKRGITMSELLLQSIEDMKE